MQNEANHNKSRKTLYLDEILCDKIEAAAEQDGRSFNAFIVRILEKAVPQVEPDHQGVPVENGNNQAPFNSTEGK